MFYNNPKKESDIYATAVFIGLIVYRIIIDNIYIYVISPLYSYSGLTCNTSVPKCLLSWGLFFVFYILIRGLVLSDKEHISTIIAVTIYIISFIPFTSIVYMGLAPKIFIIEMSIYWSLLLILLLFIDRSQRKQTPILTLGDYAIKDEAATFIGIVASLTVIFVSWIYTNFHFQLNLDVYEQRALASRFPMPQLIRYMFTWSRAIIPVMFAYCLINRKILNSIWYFLVSFISFGVDGSKTVLFMPFLVFAVVIIGKKISFKAIKIVLIYGMIAVSIISFIVYYAGRSIWLVSLFIRRVLYVPALLNVYYFDYFSKHEPDYFRSGFLSRLGANSPYAKDNGVAYTIGKIYYHNPLTGANNGLFSDAIANMGMVGIIIMPFVVAFVLWLFDRCTYGLDKRIILASAMFISCTLVSSPLTTTLMTHGLIVMMLITAVITRDNYLESSVMKNKELIKARLT